MLWYYSIDGARTKLQEDELVTGLLNGSIPMKAKVWTKGMSTWVKVPDCEALGKLLDAANEASEEANDVPAIEEEEYEDIEEIEEIEDESQGGDNNADLKSAEDALFSKQGNPMEMLQRMSAQHANTADTPPKKKKTGKKQTSNNENAMPDFPPVPKVLDGVDEVDYGEVDYVGVNAEENNSPEVPDIPTAASSRTKKADLKRNKKLEAAKKKAEKGVKSAIAETQETVKDSWSTDGLNQSESRDMSKIGIPVNLIAAMCFALYMFNTTAMVGLVLYILLYENSAWLKRQAVTALGATTVFHIIRDVLSEASTFWRMLITPIVGVIRNLPVLGDWSVWSNVTGIVGDIRSIISTIFFIIMLGFVFKALKGGSVRFKRIEKHINQIDFSQSNSKGEDSI